LSKPTSKRPAKKGNTPVGKTKTTLYLDELLVDRMRKVSVARRMKYSGLVEEYIETGVRKDEKVLAAQAREQDEPYKSI
jgi:hypothetical protein